MALSIAAQAFAQLTVNGQSSTTVTIGSSLGGVDVLVGPSSPAINFTVSPASSSWFTIYPASGTTPQPLMVYPSGNAGTCASLPGNCPSTTVAIRDNANASDTAAFTVNFSSGGTGTLTVSANQLTLSALSGALISGPVSVNAVPGISFSASVATSSCTSGWLTLAGGVTTLTGVMTPYTILVYANAGSPYLIPNGSQCTGTLTLTPANGGSSQTVGVTFDVGQQPSSLPTLGAPALAGLAILLAVAGASLMRNHARAE